MANLQRCLGVAAAFAAALLLEGCGQAGEPREPEGQPEDGQVAPAFSTCSERGANCREKGCCTELGLQCFEKDDYWADCKSDCTPGIHTDDPPDFQTAWSCSVITPPFATPSASVSALGAGVTAVAGGGAPAAVAPQPATVPTPALPAYTDSVAPDTANPRTVMAPPPALPAPTASPIPSQTLATHGKPTAPSGDDLVSSGEPCDLGIVMGALTIHGVGGNAYAGGYGGTVSGDTLILDHNSGFSILQDCVESWTPEGFKQLGFAGKTLSYTVDLGGVGCGCNLALYLIATPGLDESGNPDSGQDGDFYCDANMVGGQWCPEVDIMEANTHAFQATPHRCDAPNDAGHYSSCDRSGCGLSTVDMPNSYGPGPEYTIDTTRPFVVRTSFPEENGVVVAQRTVLEQGEQQLVLDNSNCREQLAALSDVLSSGMVLRITYWGDTAETMAWLDQPPCGEEECSSENAGSASISGLSFSSLEPPSDQPDAPALATTAAPTQAAAAVTAQQPTMPPALPFPQASPVLAAAEPPAAGAPTAPTGSEGGEQPQPRAAGAPTAPAGSEGGEQPQPPAAGASSAPARTAIMPPPDAVAKLAPTPALAAREGLPEEASGSQAADCSMAFEDCRQTLCCQDEDAQCFEKNKFFAACMPSCQPGIHAEDPPIQRTPWTCTQLSRDNNWGRRAALRGTDVGMAVFVGIFATFAAVVIARSRQKMWQNDDEELEHLSTGSSSPTRASLAPLVPAVRREPKLQPTPVSVAAC